MTCYGGRYMSFPCWLWFRSLIDTRDVRGEDCYYDQAEIAIRVAELLLGRLFGTRMNAPMNTGVT
ncbi:hypothetical protein ACCO45_009942 [Purpureocillium lilacinum]|uniref:Uncharacterized protein n=1 Tax=Purpureocillium lilacinum TaxID=33203 RepID=A0ACC4DDK5_PURLI